MLYAFVMTTELSLKITSFNVNGLGKDFKRTAIFNKLRSSSQITFLQETHSTTEVEKIIVK